MADSNPTLLVETLGRRIRFACQADGRRFERSGVVVGWCCPAAQYADELGYSLLVRDDFTGRDSLYSFHEIRLIGRPVEVLQHPSKHASA